jgi:hypothetical protein
MRALRLGAAHHDNETKRARIGAQSVESKFDETDSLGGLGASKLGSGERHRSTASIGEQRHRLSVPDAASEQRRRNREEQLHIRDS